MEHTPGNPPPRTFSELVEDLDNAEAALIAASAKVGHARREETAAVNRLNAAQRAVDTRMEKMRAQSPKGSDWALQCARSHSAVDEILKK